MSTQTNKSEILDGAEWAIKHLEWRLRLLSNGRRITWSQKDCAAVSALLIQYKQSLPEAEIGRLMIELQRFEVDVRPRGGGWVVGSHPDNTSFDSDLLTALQATKHILELEKDDAISESLLEGEP